MGLNLESSFFSLSDLRQLHLLRLSFLIYKMGIITVPISQGRCEDWIMQTKHLAQLPVHTEGTTKGNYCYHSYYYHYYCDLFSPVSFRVLLQVPSFPQIPLITSLIFIDLDSFYNPFCTVSVYDCALKNITESFRLTLLPPWGLSCTSLLGPKKPHPTPRALTSENCVARYTAKVLRIVLKIALFLPVSTP